MSAIGLQGKILKCNGFSIKLHQLLDTNQLKVYLYYIICISQVQIFQFRMTQNTNLCVAPETFLISVHMYGWRLHALCPKIYMLRIKATIIRIHSNIFLFQFPLMNIPLIFLPFHFLLIDVLLIILI